MNSDESIIERVNIQGDAVVINQTDYDDKKTIDVEKGLVKFISVRDRGLSKSRNMAVRETDADICYFSDNDLTFVDNYLDIIDKAYVKFPDASVIAFRVDSDDEDRPLRRFKTGPLNRIQTMRVYSVQISFRRDMFIENNMFLDERFGAGSGRYTNGEENIFLYKTAKSGLKVYYYDEKIATVSNEESTWFGLDNELNLLSKGAMFYEMDPILSPLLILQYVIRKRNEYKDISILKALKIAFKGAKQIKEDKKRI